MSWSVATLAAIVHYGELVGYNSVLAGMSVPEQTVASMRTENAFYYSYYEETVMAPTASAAILRAINDQRSEAPSTINALERFNVYQEVGCGLFYRLFRCVLADAWLPTSWNFYRHSSHILNAVGHGALVLLVAGCGGGGLFGAVVPGITLTLIAYLHRRESGRISDVGMLVLRENWTMPVILCQVLCLQRVLTTHSALGSSDSALSSLTWRCMLCFTTACSLILWQFSAFVFLLQVSALLLVTLLARTVGARRALEDVVKFHLVSVGVAAVFLFGNELLIHHMLVSQCVAVLLVLRLRRQPPSHRVLFWLDGALAVGLFLLLRSIQTRFATADDHIGELFVAKARKILPQHLAKHLGESPEPSFNARLYLAVSVFDFIDPESLKVYLTTCVFHFAAVAAFVWLLAFMRCFFWSPPRPTKVTKGEKHEAEAEHYAISFAYAVFLVQALFFCVLGCFMSRLKVLGIPCLFVLASAAVSPAVLRAVIGTPSCPISHGDSKAADNSKAASAGKRGSHQILLYTILFIGALVQLGYLAFVVSLMPFLPGAEFSHHREMTWGEAETGELVDWMNRRLPASSVVLTSMPLSAELRLHSPFRVVIHPQFESRSLRDRVQDAYVFYQCTPPDQFVKVARTYGSTHFIVEYKRCDFSPFMLDNRPELNCKKGEQPWEKLFCPRAHGSAHFEMLFVNSGFGLFRIRDAPTSGGDTPIASMKTWRPMLKRCMQEEPKVCPSRIAELAVMFLTKLSQQPKLGEALLSWVKENGANDGHSQYVIGRYYDQDRDQLKDAEPYYRRALALEPNNPLIIREYLMFFDVAMRDNRSLEALMRPRRWTRPDGPLSLLDLGNSNLACEASVTAQELFRDHDWSEALWNLALEKGAASDCVKNNWQLRSGKIMIEDIGAWAMFRNIFLHHKLRSHLSSNANAGVRWQPPRTPWLLGLSASFNETYA
jgi:hypothetical protein